ncbi:hypothetical protein BRD00_09315 [Halobacteriales archaeon QS_8_69_26]|nr:MAG: hypothetical protein BRD00_09315 [Halobacteriales archaeon QS_8_69_26]
MNVGDERVAVDLPDADPAAVVDAVEGEDEVPWSGGRIDLPEPGPLHDRLNPVEPGLSVSVRSALAAAARSRGLEAPQDDEIRRVEAELSGVDPEPVDAERARRRAAEAGDREAELSERVAELRGRVRAREAAGLDAGDARERLSAAAGDLAETRTERLAAEQLLDRTRERARCQRDLRERRLRLEDRLGNLEREARAHLAAVLWDEFRDAVAAVPGDGRAGANPGSFEGDPVTAALAVFRVGDPEVPAVLACGRFSDAETAAEVLDAPVIRVEG